MSAHQVQQLLVRSGAKYVDSAKSDIMGTLREFKDLSPETDNFMFPDGKRRTAFVLKGTIPVYYKGSCYNIPVKVYLWETHPYYAPICFVSPTATMVVKESETVNKEGRIFLPYLNEWRFPGYDLNGLLQVMAMVFQERCPVFAKPASGAASSAVVSQPPATPSYPSASPAVPAPYPTNPAPYPQPTPYPTSNSNSYPNPYMNTPMPPPIPGHFGVPNGSSRPPVPPPPKGSATTLQPEHIRASMISALEDKIKMRMREKLGTSYAEMASIAQTKRDLQSGQQKIRKMVDELERVQKEVEAFTFAYQEKKTELARALSESSGAEGSSIDASIDAATPLHRQLLLNHAQDMACDDVIYALGQARIRGALSMQEYLRHIRSISRRQFEYRATMQKCRRVAGLPV